MSKQLGIINELEFLNAQKKLSIDEMGNLETNLTYPEYKHYLQSLKQGVKPEFAAANLLNSLAKDILQKGGFGELKLAKSAGFVDYALQEEKANPVLIELKPPFVATHDKKGIPNGIVDQELKYEKHQEQVQKYLSANDFIILTNLNDAFLFNRDAILDFKPFHQLKFTELLRLFLDSENLWDTIRQLEDQLVKPELEKEFFEDLVKWFDQLSVVKFEEKDGFTKSELVVLLINKIIFIKTLEDYGLIPYKFLIDEYDSKYHKWEIKGIKKILDNFFTEIEEWFWDYYDTELFRTKIWDYIEKSKSNLETFSRVFETVLGASNWDRTFGKGMVHYNYRKIDEDVFGKAYETFIAQSRKDSGIYYTHRLITQYMSVQIVKALFAPVVNEIFAAFDNHDYEAAKNKMLQLYAITIADTSSGSGSYLIKTFREIYGYYQQIAAKLEWVNKIQHGMFEKPTHVTDAENFIKWTLLNDKRKLISLIILRHIHAIDIDERALETAKTNMWKEAVKLDKGLFNFRKLGSDYNHILPNLQLNFIEADAIYDLPAERQIELLAKYYKQDIAELHKIRNEYFNNPTNPDILEYVVIIKQKVRSKLQEELGILLSKPTMVCLEFFYLYFDNQGNPLPVKEQGFSGIISNPPWEVIYPVKKEFAHTGKYEMDRAEFEKEFDSRLKKDKEFKEKWDEYEAYYKQYSAYVMNAYSYHKLKPENSASMRSHLNYFKLLFERDMQLLRAGGYINILIPSSFQTDEGSYGLRKLAFIENNLIELYSFENRGFMEEGKTTKSKIFPDVHPQFKFSIVFAQKIKPADNASFNSLFYLTDPASLYTHTPLKYSLEMVRKFSPGNLSIMEFAQEKDYQLCAKIVRIHPLLGNYGYSFRREFNVTDDQSLFSPIKASKDHVPVFEGKNIHQFTSVYSPINNYTSFKDAHEQLLLMEAKRVKSDLKLELKTEEVKKYFEEKKLLQNHQMYRLIYRSVGSSTNERTLISTIIPPNNFSVNSVNYLINCSYKKTSETRFLQELLHPREMIYIMALMNSLPLNYYIRNKISANLNMFYLYELPIPDNRSQVKKEVINKAFALLYHKCGGNLYDDLRTQLGIDKKWLDGYKGKTTELRAELEILIAKDLYHLDKNDWEYLTGTFIYGEQSETKLELDEIIAKSKQLFN